VDRVTCDKLIAASSAEIAQLASAVNGPARGAAACAMGGNSSGAMRILLDVEPHLGDMQGLLDVASFANRNLDRPD
jgi:hypothetical protein